MRCKMLYEMTRDIQHLAILFDGMIISIHKFIINSLETKMKRFFSLETNMKFDA